MSSGVLIMQHIIKHISLILLVPIVIGLIRYKWLDEPYKLILLLLLFSLSIAVINYIKTIERNSNVIFFHIYTIGEFLIMARLYYLLLQGMVHKYFIPIITVLFMLFTIFWTIMYEGLTIMNSTVQTVENLLLILFSLMYFFKLMRELDVQPLERHGMFWFNAGVLIYFSGSVIIFSNANSMSAHAQSISIQVWFFHACLFIIMNFTTAVALWLSKKE